MVGTSRFFGEVDGSWRMARTTVIGLLSCQLKRSVLYCDLRMSLFFATTLQVGTVVDAIKHCIASEQSYTPDIAISVHYPLLCTKVSNTVDSTKEP